MNTDLKEFSIFIGKYKSLLTKQQIATLMGQAKNGNIIGAYRGARKLFMRKIA